jgi:hypothetical protein
VAQLVETIKAPAIATDPVLQPYLQLLARTLPYRGKQSDVDKLKQRSMELKGEPRTNRDAIYLLDNAISAHIDELRSVVSPATMAEIIIDTSSTPNSFPDFVKRKLTYLESERIKFFDRGPFEAIARIQLATAIEESYFLDDESGRGDTARLRRVQTLNEEVLTRLTAPAYDYLPSSQRNTWINDLRFANIATSFALGDKTRMHSLLREFIGRNQKFGLESRDIDHVYIHKLFNTPYTLLVEPAKGKAEHPHVSIDDPAIIKRFFNPAQLGLFMCAQLNDARPDGTRRLVKQVNDLVLSDYYVVIDSSNEKAALEQLKSELDRTITSDQRTGPRQELLRTLKALEVKGFSEAMQKGASNCGISEQVRNQIYAPFSFGINLAETAGFGKNKFHLLVGGRLNASQATAVSTFINKTALPSLTQLRLKLKLDNDAYIARMRING